MTVRLDNLAPVSPEGWVLLASLDIVPVGTATLADDGRGSVWVGETINPHPGAVPTHLVRRPLDGEGVGA